MDIEKLNLEVIDLFERLSKSQDSLSFQQTKHYENICKRIDFIESKLNQTQEQLLKLEVISKSLDHLKIQSDSLKNLGVHPLSRRIN